uniref:FBD domain-containing protein n=1 Tax=Trichuris muris TaxID=70415 RepID=A0A5S6QZH9_TRIMR
MGADADILLWAQYRSDNVRPVSNLALSFRRPCSFGKFGVNKLGPGALFLTRWSSLVRYSPNSIEISGKNPPFRAFLERLSASESDLQLFFSQTCYLALYSCDLTWPEFVTIMLFSPKLMIVDLIDCPDLLLTANDTSVMPTRNQIKGLGVSNMSAKFLNSLFSELRFQLRFLRLSGTEAMKLSVFRELCVVMSCVELLVLQNLNCDSGSLDADFFDSVASYFPNMKYFFLDWNVVSPAFTYDQATVDVLKAVAGLFTKLKLTFFCILIYCPDEETRQYVEKLKNYLQDIKLKFKLEAFSCITEPDAPDNFMLAVIGEQSNKYTSRLVEVIVRGKVTRPDLRHFDYIIDTETSLMPDTVVQFGGFDAAEVREEFSSRTEAVWLSSELDNGIRNLNT